MRKIKWGKSVLNKALLLVACFLALSGGASATTVTVDGILSAGEYTGGVSYGKKSLLWYNDHHSEYGIDKNLKNDLYWEINGADTDWSLNIFFEVPTYARRMIWIGKDDKLGFENDGIKYEYDGTNYATLDWQGIDQAYLDAYLAGSHHDSGVKMDYDTQTSSEYFQLNGISGDGHFTKWQAEDDDGLGDNFTWETSREYLIREGKCTTDKCLEFNMTASIEMMWQDWFDSEDDAYTFMGSITNMQLHLSDEARGLPVPEPTTMLLLGSGLIGLAGFRRKKKK